MRELIDVCDAKDHRAIESEQFFFLHELSLHKWIQVINDTLVRCLALPRTTRLTHITINQNPIYPFRGISHAKKV